MGDERQTVAKVRSNIYGFAARFFAKEPDSKFLQWMRTSETRSTLTEFKIDIDALLPLEETEEAMLQALAVEYTRLFIGPGKHIPPYESAHRRGGEGMLMGESASEVKQFIETCGFDFALDYHDLPDHISVELEFMQHLSSGEAEQWAAGEWKDALEYVQVQQQFLKEHLLKWVPAFCQKVTDTTELPFYFQLTSLVEAFLGFEEQGLSEAKN